jgi:hypothetical protein
MHSKCLASGALGMTLLAVSFLSLAGSARADEPKPAGPPAAAAPSGMGQLEATPDRPWAQNVPESAQKEALSLFEEGNKLFETSQHTAALAKYREALKVWDHPAIRYNAAVALINLDQPLAANENLERALRYGALPFSQETYQQAQTYRKLLHGQLAELKVSCAETGAEVSMDGAPLFVAPGETSRWMLPGPHQIVARKSGFLTETRSLTLLPGKPAWEQVALREIKTLPPKTVRRWAPWKPWAVAGAGVLVGLVGLPFYLEAQSNYDSFDGVVNMKCPMGCPASMIPQSASDSKSKGHTENIVAVSFFSVGGAVAATGLAMVILNLPRYVPAEEASHLSAAPMVGPGTFGLSLALQR